MSKLNVAICQAAPIPLDFNGGIEKATRLSREAIEAGAQFVAFGETFLGGYPLWLDESPGAALWDHPGTRACHLSEIQHARSCTNYAESADDRAAIVDRQPIGGTGVNNGQRGVVGPD